MTAAEIAEEESLFLEVKRIEQNEKRYRADRDALLRSIMGLDSGVISLDQANSEGVVGVDRVSRYSATNQFTKLNGQNKKRKRQEEADSNAAPSVAPIAPKKARESAAFGMSSHFLPSS